MKIIILEGITSTGKTTIERLLAKAFPDSKIITEGDTLMPIIDNRDPEIAVNHLKQLLQRFREEKADCLIVDRFHFTHAFRTNSSLDVFSDVEAELQKARNVLVVLLTVHPDHIQERIEETILHRKDNWKKGAQGSIKEKARYYTEQQEILASLISLSRLPSMTIDTTSKTWDEYTNKIIDHLKQGF